LLKVLEVVTHYRDVQALRSVSFQVAEGQIISIVGSNGAGKTTLLNTLSGVQRCSSGSIEFRGMRIDGLSPHQVVNTGIVQIPEGRLLFPYMTVLENLELGAFNRRARGKTSERLEMIYATFPILTERKKQFAGTLSGGEQQMVAIARGLMANPSLLMMDEPSLGLAPIMVKEVFKKTKEINVKGITILLVEQNVFHSLSMADRAYVLENGKISLEGMGKDLLANPLVKESYLGI
jgi:branched-chain amino acid transport system ATP-binding protein